MNIFMLLIYYKLYGSSILLLGRSRTVIYWLKKNLVNRVRPFTTPFIKHFLNSKHLSELNLITLLCNYFPPKSIVLGLMTTMFLIYSSQPARFNGKRVRMVVFAVQWARLRNRILEINVFLEMIQKILCFYIRTKLWS